MHSSAGLALELASIGAFSADADAPETVIQAIAAKGRFVRI